MSGFRNGSTGSGGSVNQGTPNTPGNSWPVEVTDGTNILGTVAHPLQVGGSVTTTTPALPTAPLYGQTKVAITSTAVQLPSHAITNNAGFIVQALAANAGNVVVGDSGVTTANGFELQPGQATSVALANTNDLWVNGTSGDGVCFIGS